MEPVETDEEEGTVFPLAAHTEDPGIVLPKWYQYSEEDLGIVLPKWRYSEEEEGRKEEEEEKEEKEEEKEKKVVTRAAADFIRQMITWWQ